LFIGGKLNHAGGALLTTTMVFHRTLTQEEGNHSCNKKKKEKEQKQKEGRESKQAVKWWAGKGADKEVRVTFLLMMELRVSCLTD
jgi:streptomycin 6-kinase